MCRTLALSIVFGLLSVTATSYGELPKPNSITGVYNGTYAGKQGPTKFKLSLTQQDNGTLAGDFTLYLADGSDTNEYTCDLRGRYIAANRMIQLIRGRWKTQPPAGIDMPGMNGLFDPDGASGVGQISGKMRGRPGVDFEAIRDVDESAKMAAATPDKKDAGAPSTPVARPERRPTVARPDGPPATRPAIASPDAPRPASPAPSPSSPAPSATSGPAAINGVYKGEFQRTAGNGKLKLSIKASDDGSLTALFTFDPPARKKGPSITYKLNGKYTPGSTHYAVGPSPYEFTTIEPIGSTAKDALEASRAQAMHIGIIGPGSIVGSLTGSDPKSGEFKIGGISGKRDDAETADLDKVMLAQAGGESNAVPVAPIVHRDFEGVYNGTYTPEGAPVGKLKLRLWLAREGRTAEGKLVNTEIAGLLTIVAPDGSGTEPYTTEVKGFYGDTSRVVQLTGRAWEPPPTGVVLGTGMQGKFSPDGGGQITGALFHPANPKVQLTRDPTESARMDIERLKNHIYPGLIGVFNGIYTRESGPPAKFKLTITHNRDGADGIDGLATIYLPADTGTRAYSYDLKGLELPHGEFQLRVHDWVTPPPANFENFRGMGFDGKVVLNEALTSAQINNTPPAPSMASFYIPKFEATYGATESTDIHATLAAQKAAGSAEQAAALKARDEMLSKASPKQLASNDLVRKSRHYWGGFKYDMIREVFDGGFGPAIDENKQFQMVFCSYVEMFAAKCPECLPPNHQRVTNIVRFNRKFDKFGNLVSEENHDYTVDMDPRFVEKYKQCWTALNSNEEQMRLVIAARGPGGAQGAMYELMSLATDMLHFFADHPGKSAAMRQINENFVLAINDEPSLQESGGKIEGAQAESDKDVLPGRYARFVDGANAYFRERAKANPTKFGGSSSHDTALCQRLAELYEFHMTRDEEYYYANDFAARFLPIMGQRANCPDPAWPQLHPDVEKAIAEVK